MHCDAMIIKDAHTYCDQGFKKVDISIDGNGRISDIGPCLKGDEVFDAGGLIVLPGLHNSHMHASTSLIRGFPVNGGLDSWVSSILWEFEKDLTPGEVYSGSLYSICQMLRSGITYFEDMHFLETEVLRACENAGIKASLSEAVMDRNGWGRKKANIRTSLELAKMAKGSELVDAKLGIVSVRMCSEELIDAISQTYAEHSDIFGGFHLHMDETSQDGDFSRSEYGCPPAQFFLEKGVLGPDTTIAHCVHIDDKGMSILSKAGSRVALCPSSNIRLGSGTPPVREMMERGIRLSIGIDSPAINDGYDIFSDSRLLASISGLSSREMLGIMLDGSVVKPGMDADLVFLDRRDALPLGGLDGHICLSINSRSVVHTMVQGEFVVFDREVLTLDEASVVNDAERASASVIDRLDIL